MSFYFDLIPFLSLVIVKLKLVVSPGLLILTRTAINQYNTIKYLVRFCPKVTVHMLFDGEEYQAATVMSVIVQEISPHFHEQAL